MNSEHIAVHNAHTGAVFKIRRFFFVSLEEFKRFCTTEFGIPTSRLFFLSSFGILVKNSSFEEIDDIFVYDKELFSTHNSDQLVKQYIRSQKQQSYDSLIQPLRSPLLDISLENVAKSRNSKQLMSLLTTNLGWVAAIESDTTLSVSKLTDLNSQIEVLLRSINVASQYINSYCSNIKQSFDSSIEFFDDIRKHSLVSHWSVNYSNLQNLKTIDNGYLANLLDYNELSHTSKETNLINELITEEFHKLTPIIEESSSDRNKLKGDFDSMNKDIRSIVDSKDYNDVYADLSKLTEKVRNDTKNLLNKTSSSIDDLDVDIIIETFQLHKSNYVEKIYELSLSIYKTSLKWKELYKNLQFSSYQTLQKLAAAQVGMVSLKENLKPIIIQIEQLQQFESILAHTVDLPLLYGLYIVESMRRDQWIGHMKSITIKTNEKFAHLREREIKTRNQWINDYGIILKLLSHDVSSFNNRNIVSFEVVKNEDITKQQQDSVVSYEDCVNYIAQLEQQKYISKDVTDVLSKTLKESIFKKPNLTLDESSSSKQANSETIKGYKTRIKKLENLLHHEQFKNFSQWPSNIGSTSRLPRTTDSKVGASTFDNTNSSMLLSFSRSVSPTAKSEAVNKLEEENKQLIEKVESQQKLTNSLKEELRTLKQSLSAKEFSVQSSAQKNKELVNAKQIEINNLTRNLAAEEVKSLSVLSELSSKDELIQTLNSRLEKQKQQHAELNKGYAKAIEEGNISRDAEIDQLKSQLEAKLREKDEDIINLKETHKTEMVSRGDELLQKKVEIEDLKKLNNEKIKQLTESNAKELSQKDKHFQEFKSENEEAITALKAEHEEQIKSLSSSDDSPYAKEQVDKFENDLTEFQDEIVVLKAKLKVKDEEISGLKDKILELEDLILSKGKELDIGSAEVAQVEAALTQLRLSSSTSIKELTHSKEDYERQLKSLSEDFDRLKSMKNDLLENMANREEEFTKEKIVYQEEIEQLRTKIEEFEKFEQVKEDTNAEIIAKYKHLNLQLLIIINSLVIKSRDLTDILVTFYDMLLTSLKSLGLLAVINENKNNVTDIIRVKGLRKNNKLGLSADNLNISSVVKLDDGFKPISIDDVISLGGIWTSDSLNADTNMTIQKLTQLNDEGSDANEEENTSGEEFFNNLNDLIINNYNLITFEKKYLALVKSVTNLNSIYLSCVSKRFNEVENLAKKELKENKKLRIDRNHGKIAIQDFQVGDYVLFLPTKVSQDDKSHDSNDTVQVSQWAAFNNMGDCKFLMKHNKQINPNKQWFIGKILDIEKVNNKDFLLTTEEVKN